MNAASVSSGNLLINGAFLPGLWGRLAGANPDFVPCPVEAQTFAADRWRVRYAAPNGGEVSQARSDEVPPGAAAGSSSEIRGGEGVAQTVYLGQTIEADEAACYRHELRLSAWCLAEHPTLPTCPVRLQVRHAIARNVFDSSMETLTRTEPVAVAANIWTRLDFTLDATASRGLGLCVEFELPPDFLSHPNARVRFTAATLWPARAPEPAPRPNALEAMLARRFFQHHSARSINAIGRALVCNPHELHFQFTFPEMRAFPAITLPQDNDDLTVFAPDGSPQGGFVYDVPHCARGSAIIRATRHNHELRDGYLAFRGYRGAILLEAEM